MIEPRRFVPGAEGFDRPQAGEVRRAGVKPSVDFTPL